MTPVQFAVAQKLHTVLSDGGCLTLTELAEATGTPYPNLGAIIGALIRASYVSRAERGCFCWVGGPPEAEELVGKPGAAQLVLDLMRGSDIDILWYGSYLRTALNLTKVAWLKARRRLLALGYIKRRGHARVQLTPSGLAAPPLPPRRSNKGRSLKRKSPATPTMRQRTWNALRILGRTARGCTITDILPLIGHDTVTPTARRAAIRSYLQGLVGMGVLCRTEPPGETRYRLLQNSGPLAPIVKKGGDNAARPA